MSFTIVVYESMAALLSSLVSAVSMSSYSCGSRCFMKLVKVSRLHWFSAYSTSTEERGSRALPRLSE